MALWPKAGALASPKRLPPPLVPVEGCPKEKEPALLVQETAPKRPLLPDTAVDVGCPKVGTAPNADCPNEKLLAELLAGCPKAGVWPNTGWVNPPVAALPNTGTPNADPVVVVVQVVTVVLLLGG